jgi:gas vesicle protein
MSETGETWSNELMEEEDQLHEEMQEEFRRRLQKRLQKKIEAKEDDMPEVRRLKKKGRSSCD